MYVCVCNALNETQVRAALAQRPATVDGVYAALGVDPKCGTCRGEIARLLSDPGDHGIAVAAE